MGRSHKARSTLVAVAISLGVLGLILLTVGLHAQQHAPQPPAAAAGTYTPQPSATSPGATNTTRDTPAPAIDEPKGPVLPKSAPINLRIPAIGVDSSVIQLGLNPNHTVQVPPLGADSRAGWYRYSPTPGQLGPSILLGHIDSAKYGPGVFFRLGALRKGDAIFVRRADKTVAVFRVDAVAEYSKNRFPTLTVYGDTDHAALRLITCGGKFDFSAHSYEDNIVAFASLVSSHKV